MSSLVHDDYYALLRVEPSASEREISQAYKRVAMEYHPDKTGTGDAQMFTKCAQAYQVLSDPVSRRLYDMVVGVRAESAEERKQINKLKREEARNATRMMEKTVESIRAEEEEREGLVILEALYGDLAKAHGGVINVTVPLQCMVDESVLIIRGGSSKSWLEGFYDPSEGGENELFVRYRFLNRLHECTVNDTDEVCIPLEEHFVDETHVAKQNYKEKRKEKKRVARTKSRRRFFLFSAIATVVGFFLARRSGYFANIKSQYGVTSPMLLKFFGAKEETEV